MGSMSSQITSFTIVYSTVYSRADQRKHQSSASLALVRGIHRWPVISPHKGPVTRKMFPFDDVIMKGLSAVSENGKQIASCVRANRRDRESVYLILNTYSLASSDGKLWSVIWESKVKTARFRYSTASFSKIPTKSIQKLCHEGGQWSVFCELKIWKSLHFTQYRFITNWSCYIGTRLDLLKVIPFPNQTHRMSDTIPWRHMSVMTFAITGNWDSVQQLVQTIDKVASKLRINCPFVLWSSPAILE